MSYSDKARAFLSKHGMAPESIDLESAVAAFLDEMTAGLSGRESTLRMLPTYLSAEGTLPLARPAAVIDAGGTNFRSALVTFTPSGPIVEGYRLSPMPGSAGPVSWDEFIAFTADRLLPLLPRAETVGFCFSYPTEETPYRDGRLIALTKQIVLTGFEGRLICRDLRARLAQLGAGERQITLLNDTPAVLLSGVCTASRGKYSGLSGLICGTGTNTCCDLPVAAIGKLGRDFSGRMLVNLESGGFSRLPRGDYDEELDRATSDPGAQQLEKMTSGAYIGELCRLTLRGAAAEGLFSAPFAERIFALRSLSAQEADRLASGACADLEAGSDRSLASELCRALIHRAARCVCSNLSAILLLTDTGNNPEHPACVCADGAVFTRGLTFRPALEELMSRFPAERLGRHAVFHTAANATMLGSAAAALLNIK